MKSLLVVCLSIVTAATALAQAPTITAVENAATNIPPGLPNSAVAQGALFVVKGTNLGPAALAIATAFPLPAAIGGTSAQVTVGGAMVDAIMYYSLAGQIAAILPSKAPTGIGTVKVTYNGQSASAPITVVQNNIGVFTLSTTGSGDAVATLPANSTLVSLTNAPNPGEAVTLWATGLGPVTSDETRAQTGGDMPNVPLQVFVGGKPASVLYRGRTNDGSCCSGVDIIYVTVPQGLSGCAVSVIMQIGNIVSNATTIPVATSGRTCTPTNPGATITPGTHTFGGISLLRSVIITPGFGGIPGMTTKSDSATAIFLKTTPTSSLVLGSQVDIASYGSCTVVFYSGRTTPPSSSAGMTQYLDAGPSIGMTGPPGSRTLSKATISGVTYYAANLDMTATTLTAGQYTFVGTGGADVGPFTANYNAPQPLTWTNQDSITTVNRANGVTVTWTGGDPAGYVSITGQNFVSGATAAATVGASFTCIARATDGTFTVPAIVLLALPASATIAGFTIPGNLVVTSASFGGSFQASGIEIGGIVSSFVSGIGVPYQ
jgi:uncharacterized protein (TIGR03437 family)